jgi:hypothetical protein
MSLASEVRRAERGAALEPLNFWVTFHTDAAGWVGTFLLSPMSGVADKEFTVTTNLLFKYSVALPAHGNGGDRQGSLSMTTVQGSGIALSKDAILPN